MEGYEPSLLMSLLKTPNWSHVLNNFVCCYPPLPQILMEFSEEKKTWYEKQFRIQYFTFWVSPVRPYHDWLDSFSFLKLDVAGVCNLCVFLVLKCNKVWNANLGEMRVLVCISVFGITKISDYTYLNAYVIGRPSYHFDINSNRCSNFKTNLRGWAWLSP